MKPEMLKLYETVKATHAQSYSAMIELRNALSDESEMTELVDAALVLRDGAQMLDDLRKELNKLRDVTNKRCCMAWLTSDGDPIRTTYATGMPKVKQVPRMPKHGSEEYEQLCAAYGFDPRLPFRPHWPSMVEDISERLAEGRPVPEGCDPNAVYQVFDVELRSKGRLGDDD
jgi:hypothetical protein